MNCKRSTTHKQKLLKFNIPLKLFVSKSKEVNKVSNPITEVIVPDNLLLFRLNTDNFVIDPIPEGIVPIMDNNAYIARVDQLIKYITI